MSTEEIIEGTEKEKDKIIVSVVMPIYNAAEYLSDAIDSVLRQTLKEIELICIDDGSTDGSFEVIKAKQADDRRIRIVTENNAGPSVARNKGLVRARGEYVIFLDADDFFEPTLLERLYNLAVRKKLDIAVATYDLYNNANGKHSPMIGSEHGDLLAVIPGGQLDLAHGGIAPGGKVGPPGNRLAIQSRLCLLEEPGVAEAAAADHGHIRPGLL